MSSLLGIKPTTVLRVLSFGAGVGAAGGVYLYTHRQLWGGTAQVAQLYGAPSPQQSTPHGEAPELFYGARTRATLVRSWNLAVDSTLGVMAAELAKRGI